MSIEKTMHADEAGLAETFQIHGQYSDGKLVISDMFNNYGDIEFDLDLTTGEATATDQIAYSLGILKFYYFDLTDTDNDKVNVVKGIIGNYGENQSILKIQDWGIRAVYSGTSMKDDPLEYFKNTQIIFDFHIPGLEVEAEPNPGPGSGGDDEPEFDPNGNYVYRVSCEFSATGSSWNIEDIAGSVVEFTEDKLILKNMCGGYTLEGDILEGENRAVFQNKFIVDQTDTFTAYYNDGGQQIEPDKFYFEFNESHTTIKLADMDGHQLIIGAKYKSGYWGVRWTDVTLNLYPVPVPTPPAECESYFLSSEFTNGYDEARTQVIEVFTLDNTVWFKDMIYPELYMKGSKLNNGNIRFSVPQFQGVNRNFLVQTYAVKNGSPVNAFDLVLQDNGSYLLESGVQVYRGDILEMETLYMRNAIFKPSSSYDGAPKKPENVEWDGQNEHLINFTLPMTGLNGEELNPDWTYWQVLADGKPYQFTNHVYGGWLFMNESLDYISANAQYSGWGKLGNGKYAVYLPTFTSADNIEIRCGYQPQGGEIKWSEAVPAVEGEIIVTPLPEEALYDATVIYDTQDGEGFEDEGVAIFANFSDGNARLSGFFGQNGWIEGSFGDARMQKAVFASPQTIGTDSGKTVELVAATLSSASTSQQMMFQKLDEFTLNVTPGGSRISMDPSLFLLEVTDGQISNVIKSINMVIVTEKAPEIPENAVLSNYFMQTIDIYGNSLLTPVQMYQENNNVWIDGLVRYGNETAIIAGKKVNANLEFSFPQFLGVMRGKIAYASSDDWSFDPGKITFTPTEDGGYECEGEIWVGPGGSWPEWRAGMNYVLIPDNGEPQAVLNEMSVGAVTANTASINLTYTFFNVPENAVCKVDVKELYGTGTWSFVIPTPETFTASNLVMLTDLKPSCEYLFDLTVSIVSEDDQIISVSDARIDAFTTIAESNIENEGNGNMVYQFDVNAGRNNPMLNSPESCVVTGTYNNGILTVSDMLYNYLPLELAVNLENGEVIAEDQVANNSNGNLSYYCSVSSGQPIVRGSIKNVKGTNGEWCELTLDPWGEADIVNNRARFHSAFYNTRIVFDFIIPNLNGSGTSAIENFYEEAAEVRYFTVDGIEVKNPVKGRIYIKIENNKSSKVVL